MGRGHLGAWPGGRVPLPQSTHRPGLATDGIPRGGGSREPVRRLLPPQRPGGAAGQGGALPPTRSLPPAGGGSSPGLLGPVAALLVSFPRARPLSFSLPPALESPVPSPLSSLSSNVTSSGRLSGTTLATSTSPQASLLIPSLFVWVFFPSH